jgi:membrane protein implicated in regulation of membrane protease activity
MEQYVWLFWIVLGVILIIAEVFTMGFVLFWFGIGALAAGVAGLFGLGFFWQFMAFAVVSIAFTAMSRTLFSRYFALGKGSSLKMGIESLPGKIGTVTVASRGALQQGAVKVYGSEWTAYPIDGEKALIEGEKVEVVEIKGASIYVRQITRELPDWRGD